MNEGNPAPVQNREQTKRKLVTNYKLVNFLKVFLLLVDWSPDLPYNPQRKYKMDPGATCHVLDNNHSVSEIFWLCSFRIGRTCTSPTDHECIYREVQR